MARMTRQEAERFLEGRDHRGTAILSISRIDRGPLSVPLAFRFANGGFEFQTKLSRRHAREFTRAGRATVMVHFERYDAGATIEQYVMAEGPVGFVSGVPNDPEVFATARLEPETFIGMEYH